MGGGSILHGLLFLLLLLLLLLVTKRPWLLACLLLPHRPSPASMITLPFSFPSQESPRFVWRRRTWEIVGVLQGGGVGLTLFVCFV